MGAFRNFAISFTILSILAGCLPGYYLAFHWGGPVSAVWGWLIVGIFTTFVALSLAEIASSFPTAGGPYYWSSKLGSPGWGWFTGWFNLLGVTGTGAIGYGLAVFAASLLNLLWGYPNDRHHIFYLFVVLMVVAVLLNVLDLRTTSLVNAVSVYWHVLGVAVIVVALIAVPDHHESARYVFTETVNDSGLGGEGWGGATFLIVFAIGSIGLAQYTLAGYDASAHMAEETHNASRSAAVGMLTAVLAAVVCGFVLLLALTFAIPSRTGVRQHYGDIAAYIWQTSMGTRWAEALLLIVVCAQFFCLVAAITAGSRLLFAFSRDRAVPGDRAWRKVSRRRVPTRSVLAVGASSFLLMVPTWWNNLAGYYVGASVGVTSLYIAYSLPVILRLRAGSRFEPGAWSLGKHHRWINSIALAWIVLISIVFMLPTSPAGMPWQSEFDLNFVNYAPVTIGAAFMLFGGWYALSARRWFTGPVRMGSDRELELQEAQRSQFLLPADATHETA
jgi:amino acid transporter